MSVVAAAIIGSSVVGVGATLASSSSQKKAIEKGAETEKKISQDNIKLQKEVADTQRTDLQPWRKSGEASLNRLMKGVSSGAFDLGKFNTPKFGVVDVKKDPGYKFRLKEGVKARDYSANARGRLNSGAQDKAITRYGQDYASNEYAKAYGREVDKYNRAFDEEANRYALDANAKARKFNILSGLANQGQNAAVRQASATQQLGVTSGNILSNSGRSQNISSQQIGNANPYGGIATGVNTAAQNWLTYKMNTPTPQIQAKNAYSFQKSQGSV